MTISPYFSISSLPDSTFYQLPKVFQINGKYQELSAQARICWSVLYGLQRNCIEMGWYEKKSGRIYFYHLDAIIQQFVTKTGAAPLIQELIKFQLLETDELRADRLGRYYLMQPEQNHGDLIARQKEEFDFLMNVNNHVQSDPNYKSFLLRELIDYKHITDEAIIQELYETVMIDQKDEEFDSQKIDKLFQNLIAKPAPAPKPVPDPSGRMLQEAKQFMASYLTNSERAQLTDEELVVLYKNIDHIEYLRRRNQFNMSLLLTLKSQHKLASSDFAGLLENAFHLYDYQESNQVHFVYFFEHLLNNRELVEKERILIDEITDKLYALPNHLKKFVYDQMIKMADHFPERYRLLIHNLRVINKIYQDQGGKEMPDAVFEKAFRSLLLDHEIRNITAFFRKGIEFAVKDLTSAAKTAEIKQQQPQKQENKDESNWLELIVSSKETKGDVEKMDTREKEAYFSKGEELRKRLESLRNKQ